jgi:hypothetical protein
VPSVGTGRRQRFPEAALPVFRQLKEEGMARRGRRRDASSKSRSQGARKAGRRGRGTTAGAADREALLTLVEIGRRTGISYPTLLRYVRLHLDRLPHTGSGRQRRFRPASVAEFRKLREESRRGRRGGRSGAAAATGVAGAELRRRLAALERGQVALAGQIRDLRKAIARPIRIKLY